MEQDRLAGRYREEHVRNAAAIKVGTHLEEAISHRATRRHANRPAKLDETNIISDRLAVRAV